jgi:hypothetical protein
MSDNNTTAPRLLELAIKVPEREDVLHIEVCEEDGELLLTWDKCDARAGLISIPLNCWNKVAVLVKALIEGKLIDELQHRELPPISTPPEGTHFVD